MQIEAPYSPEVGDRAAPGDPSLGEFRAGQGATCRKANAHPVKVQHFLATAWVMGLLGLSWALHGQADRCEAEAHEAGQRLQRIRQDQPDLYEIRDRARRAQQRSELERALSQLSSQQLQLLAAMVGLNWTYLEWEPEGFYLESAGAGRLKTLFPNATPESNRIAGLWL